MKTRVTAGGTSPASMVGSDVYHDIIWAPEGNDTLYGGAGNDTLRGGKGNDVLDGGPGIDAAEFVDKKMGEDVIVTLKGGTAVTATVAGVAEDTLRDIENLIGGAGNDIFLGDGLANVLSGGGGHDTLKGNAGSDMLSGGSGDDSLDGGTGNDSADGGADNDTISGGVGNDSLLGGTGADWFLFNTTLRSTNIDRLMDFTKGTDKLVLDDDIFTKLGTGTTNGKAISAGNYKIGTKAGDADDYLFYDPTTDKLFYDADGNGSGVAVPVATIVLAGTAAPAYTDFWLVA